MPRIQTRDGVELYVKDQGQGPAVVLLHGWPLSADSFDDHALALVEAGHRVVSYDRRGFGRSGQPWDGYDYDNLADDLADVVRAMGLDGFALVGFSMGGGEVARYMSRHGGKGVTHAVLISSVVPYVLRDDTNPDGVPEATIEDMKAKIREDRPHFYTSFFQQFYGVGYVTSPVSEEVLEWSRTVAMQGGLRATLACIDAFARTDFRPDLAAFNVPTLVIHGTSDNTVPIDATGRAAAAAIPGATLIEYSGSPHGLLATDKQRSIDDLVGFLRG